MKTAAAPLHTDLLDRLRAETREEHLAIERTLDLMRADLSMADYAHVLRRFYGFYAPLEERLAGAAARSALDLDFDGRRKAPLLRADVEWLGGTAPQALAMCAELPAADTGPQAMGCLYVLEGAALGGQVIGRHLETRLGVTPTAGGRFFHGNGARTGSVWREFRDAMMRFAAGPAADDDAVVRSARATFVAMRRWYAPHTTDGGPAGAQQA